MSSNKQLIFGLLLLLPSTLLTSCASGFQNRSVEGINLGPQREVPRDWNAQDVDVNEEPEVDQGATPEKKSYSSINVEWGMSDLGPDGLGAGDEFTGWGVSYLTRPKKDGPLSFVLGYNRSATESRPGSLPGLGAGRMRFSRNELRAGLVLERSFNGISPYIGLGAVWTTGERRIYDGPVRRYEQAYTSGGYGEVGLKLRLAKDATLGFAYRIARSSDLDFSSGDVGADSEMALFTVGLDL